MKRRHFSPCPRVSPVSVSVILRDGVTGNTSGFEPEDEGSIPSPAAKHPTDTKRFEPKNAARIQIRRTQEGTWIVQTGGRRSYVFTICLD